MPVLSSFLKSFRNLLRSSLPDPFRSDNNCLHYGRFCFNAVFYYLGFNLFFGCHSQEPMPFKDSFDRGNGLSSLSSQIFSPRSSVVSFINFLLVFRLFQSLTLICFISKASLVLFPTLQLV